MLVLKMLVLNLKGCVFVVPCLVSDKYNTYENSMFAVENVNF